MGNKYKHKSFISFNLSTTSGLVSLQLPFPKLVSWSIEEKKMVSGGVVAKAGKALFPGFHVLVLNEIVIFNNMA